MDAFPLGVVFLAAGLDYLLGDPWGWPHPVRVMGWLIQRYTQIVFTYCKTPAIQRWAGIFLGVTLVVGSGLTGWIVIWAARSLHPGLGLVLEIVLLASCFAGRSLRAAAADVLTPLQAGEIDTARLRLRNYVGRDTQTLSESEILRAVLETVTENATDGVLAPLFYALLGLTLPGVGSVPLALAYKAASTLDSTVGYRDAPYTHLGWFSARLDDTLTWLPCRFTVFTVALLSGRPQQVWQLCRRDAPADPSPNAGWSECAYAAALQVQVGGLNWYRGVAKSKPFLGDPIATITPATISQALQLTRYSCLLWLGLSGLLSLFLWLWR